MKHKLMQQLIYILVLAVCSCAALAQSGGDITLDWTTTSGGGGACASTGGLLSLSGTIGQPASDLSAGGSFSLAAGFWAAEAPSFGPPLSITRSGSYVIITWQSASADFNLQTTEDLTAQSAW